MTYWQARVTADTGPLALTEQTRITEALPDFGVVTADEETGRAVLAFALEAGDPAQAAAQACAAADRALRSALDRAELTALHVEVAAPDDAELQHAR